MVQDLRKMVDRIRKFQLLNDQIFASLNRYLLPGHDRVRPAFAVVTEHFTPPTHQNPVSEWFRFHLFVSKKFLTNAEHVVSEADGSDSCCSLRSSSYSTSMIGTAFSISLSFANVLELDRYRYLIIFTIFIFINVKNCMLMCAVWYLFVC